MYWSAVLVTLVPPVVVTVTLTVPVPAGEVAVHELAAQLTLVAAVAPKDTLPPVRLAPLMVTTVPPVLEPVIGLKPVTVGAGTGVGTICMFRTY